MSGNGRSGRNPRPHSLAILSPHHRRSKAKKQIPVKGKVVKPSDLSDDASEFWDDVCARLIRMKIATPLDVPQMTLLCELWSLLRRSMTALDRNPVDKNARVSMLSYQAAFDRLSSRFGLSPSDRQRLGQPTGKTKKGIPQRNRKRDGSYESLFIG